MPILGYIPNTPKMLRRTWMDASGGRRKLGAMDFVVDNVDNEAQDVMWAAGCSGGTLEKRGKQGKEAMCLDGAYT